MISFVFIGWNVITFLLYGIDKLCAKLCISRISERLLLASAFLFGGLGAGLGMLLFRHKIRKRKFCLLIPAAIVINLAISAGIYLGFVRN